MGVLVGRFENEDGRSGFKLLRPGCALTARSGSEDRLGIGANDYRANDVRELGQGNWQVTVIWSSLALSEPCQGKKHEELIKNIKSVTVVDQMLGPAIAITVFFT